MSGNQQEDAPQALRELAQWVVRDGVDSDHLNGYMHRLLSARLVELHAECRRQAMVLGHRGAGLPPRDVAFRLCQTAREIEQAACHAPSAPSDRCGTPPGVGAMVQVDCDVRRRPRVTQITEHPSYIPEFVVSFLFLIVGLGFLMNWPQAVFPRSAIATSDRILQLTVAVAYIFLGLLSAYEGARRVAWHCRSHAH
jgi:hypothetical protein